jgi:hypothetical protein
LDEVGRRGRIRLGPNINARVASAVVPWGAGAPSRQC